MHTEVFRMLDQEPFKKLVHACEYGLLKQALYLKCKPEAGRLHVNGEDTHCAHSSVRMRQNFKWILVKQPENLCSSPSLTSTPFPF